VVFAFTAIALAQGPDFAGRVIEDSSGEPVASAELRIHKAGLRELVADLETDRAGRFTGAELAAGDYTVDVSRPNFITTTFPIHVPNTAVQVRLLRYGVMDGRVANVRGEAIAGRVQAPGGRTIGATRITVLAKQPGSEEFRSFRDTSLEDGHFRFFDLPPGQYKLGMWFYGINEGSGMQLYPDNANPKVFTIAGGEVYSNLNFLVTPGTQYKVSGRIDLPAPGVQFQLALGLPDQPTLPVGQTLTADDGTFAFDKVPAGTYDLFAAGPTGGYTAFESVLGGKGGDPMFGHIRIQVFGPTTDVSVPLTAGRSLSVILRPHTNSQAPAAPVPSGCPQTAAVALTPLQPWAIAFFNATAQASFSKEQTIKNLPPARFRVTASGLGTGCYQVNQRDVDLSENVTQPVAVEVAAAGSIRGMLRGAGAAGLVVVLIDAAAGTDDYQARMTSSDAQGRFSFETLRPGRYRIAAVGASDSAKGRWVENPTRMTEIEIPGGVVTTIELPVESPVAGRP
jgi:hypothetical protein